MERLPLDALRLIALRLPLSSASTLLRSCKSCHRLQIDDTFWSLLLGRDFPHSAASRNDTPQRSRNLCGRYRRLREAQRAVSTFELTGSYDERTRQMTRRLLSRIVETVDAFAEIHLVADLVRRLTETHLDLLYQAVYHYDENRRARPHDLALLETHRCTRESESHNIHAVQTLLRSFNAASGLSSMRLLLRIVVLAADEYELILRVQNALGKPTGVGVRGIYPALVILGLV